VVIHKPVVPGGKGNLARLSQPVVSWASLAAAPPPPVAVESGARVYNSGAQTIPYDTETVLQFDTTRWDTDDYFDIASPTQLTVPEDGIYAFGGSFAMLEVDNKWYRASVRMDGATFICRDAFIINQTGPANYSQKTVGLYKFSAGHYIELLVYQTAGNPSQNTVVAAEYSVEFWIHRIT
jgi:hypothetical protein